MRNCSRIESGSTNRALESSLQEIRPMAALEVFLETGVN